MSNKYNDVIRLSLMFILLLSLPGMQFAQINWTQYTIADDFNGADCVYAIDLDTDGDVDVIASAWPAFSIIWWENDGNENFSEHTITSSFNGADWVYAIDMDDDNDVDVLGTAWNEDVVAWWENDGDENFTEHTIAEFFESAFSVYGTDIDDDSDVDVLGTAYAAGEIAWWESDLITGIKKTQTSKLKSQIGLGVYPNPFKHKTEISFSIGQRA